MGWKPLCPDFVTLLLGIVELEMRQRMVAVVDPIRAFSVTAGSGKGRLDHNPAHRIVDGAENVKTRFNAGKAVGEDRISRRGPRRREPMRAGAYPG